MLPHSELNPVMQRIQSIVGAGDNRQPLDSYPTPTHAIRSLLRREQFPGLTWEPAEGDGRIVRLMRERGYDVVGSDIQSGVDFLATRRIVSNIVTNPPWGSLALPFITHAKRCARRKIALLLQLSFLHGVERYEMFQDTGFPLKAVYIFSRRLQFDAAVASNPMLQHAWFVWDKAHVGEPLIRWIDPAEHQADEAPSPRS